jgi:hypothetical protein
MGGFWGNLKKTFTAQSGDSSSDFIIFKVRCDRCNEEITVRIRKNSDISSISAGEGPEGAAYFLRKEILGKKCGNLINIKVYFGYDYYIISREIRGGKFVE